MSLRQCQAVTVYFYSVFRYLTLSLLYDILCTISIHKKEYSMALVTVDLSTAKLRTENKPAKKDVSDIDFTPVRDTSWQVIILMK